MAKTKATPQPAWAVTFVQCELDKDTRERVKAHDPKYEQTFDGLDRLIADGYKVSIARDAYHDCVGVFCTMPDKSHPHAGLCLTARGPSYLSALKVLVFKHFTILDGDWGTTNQQSGAREDWG